MTVCYSNKNRKLYTELDGVNMGLTSKLLMICKVLLTLAQCTLTEYIVSQI